MILLYKQLKESESFEEYADIVYRLLFMFSFDIIFFIFVIKSVELFTFIDNLEDTISRSKCENFSKFSAESVATSQLDFKPAKKEHEMKFKQQNICAAFYGWIIGIARGKCLIEKIS